MNGCDWYLVGLSHSINYNYGNSGFRFIQNDEIPDMINPQLIRWELLKVFPSDP